MNTARWRSIGVTPEAAIGQSKPQDASSQAPDVLVLGATPETRQALDAWLDPTRYQLEYRERDNAPEQLEHSGYRLMILELAGSERNDVELVKRAGRNPRPGGLPVLLIAPEAGHADMAEMLAAGARDTLWKPLRKQELVGRLWFHRASERRRREAANQQRTLRVLLELTHSLVSSLDLHEIMYTMVSRLADVVHVDRVSIVLVPDDSGTGYVVAASDDAGLTNLPLQLSKYPEIRHVLSSRVALTIDDVATHPVLDSVRRSVTDAGHGSLSLIPIMWEDQVMGVLFIRAGHHDGMPSNPQLDLCQVLANATAIALRNARLLQSLHDETARDNRARREAEERLSTLKRYADLLTSSADGVVAFDANGRLIFGNPGAHSIMGYTEDAVGPDFPLGKVLAPESRATVAQLRAGFARGDYPRNVDIIVLRRDGQRIVANGSFSPVRGTRGAVLFSFRDATEERRTEGELVQTRNFLQSLIDASVDAIVASDMKGQIVLFNEGAQRLYGYAEPEGLKLNVRRLYPGDGAREVMRMLRSEAHGGYGRLEPVRMEAVDSSGEIFPISLTSALIYEDGKAIASFGIFTDLRERIRVEEQLAQAQDQLAMGERQSLLAELAGATAHELNQPLTSIMGSAELLQRRLDEPGKARLSAEVILHEAQRMADIVRKIGQLTEYETKSYVGHQKIIDLDAHRSIPPGARSSAPPRISIPPDAPTGGRSSARPPRPPGPPGREGDEE